MSALLSRPLDRRRLLLAFAALAIIAAGLLLRTYGYGFGLPFVAVKYGGSALWAAMVYCLIASFFPARASRHIGWAALIVAICVECFRLVHTPGLDAFRLTPAGALLLGRVFSLWNVVAYMSGIVLAAALDLADLALPQASATGNLK